MPVNGLVSFAWLYVILRQPIDSFKIVVSDR